MGTRQGSRQGWWKRSKFRWDGRQLSLDKTVGSRVWRHTQGSSGRPASDLGWGSSSKTAPGSLSTGSPAGRTPPHGDGSMYSQANVREESVLRPPTRALPSVIVDTEKVLREADGSVKLVVVRPHTDGKGVRPGVRLKNRMVRAGRSPKDTSAYFPCNGLHCPGVVSRAKGEENCRYTSLQIKTQLIQFIALFFLSISSVSTEQWQLYAKNLRAIKIDRGNLWYWWVNQSFLAKSKQKLPWMTKLFGSSTFNKLNRFHQKTKWVNSVRKQDLCAVVEVGQYFVTKDTGDFRQFRSVACREYTLPRDDPASQPEGWIQGNMRNWTCNWKSRPVFSTSNMELKFELSPWIKTILILGSEFPMERSNTWSILFKTTKKFLQIHKKSKFHKQAQVWLQPGQRQKQNLNREYSLGQQQPYQYMKADGLTLSQQNKILASYDLSKKVINLLRHNQTLQREEDGAIEFYKIKFHLRNHHSQIHNWSDDRWKACLAAGGGSKRRYQCCSDNSGTILYLRAL